MELDDRGWAETGTVMAEAFAGIERIRREAEARLEGSSEPGMTVTASVLFFESPQLDDQADSDHLSR